MKKLLCLMLCICFVGILFAACGESMDGLPESNESDLDKPDVSDLQTDMSFADDGSNYHSFGDVPDNTEVYDSDLGSIVYLGSDVVKTPLPDEDGNLPMQDEDGNYMDAEGFVFTDHLVYNFKASKKIDSSVYFSFDSILVNGFALPCSGFYDLNTEAGVVFSVPVADGYLRTSDVSEVTSFAFYGLFVDSDSEDLALSSVISVLGEVDSSAENVRVHGHSVYESDDKSVGVSYVGRGTGNVNTDTGVADDVFVLYAYNCTDKAATFNSTAWFNGVACQPSLSNNVIPPHSAGYMLLTPPSDAEPLRDIDEFDSVTVSLSVMDAFGSVDTDPVRLI